MRTKKTTIRVRRRAAKKAAKRPAKKTAKKTSRKTPKKAAKKAARKTAKKTAKKTARKTAKKTAKRRAKTTASKRTKRPAKKVSRKPAARVAKKPTPAAAKQAADKQRQESSSTALPKLSKLSALKKDKRPILVPVDFSAHSEAALAYAAHLAEKMQVPLAVLHVVHDPGEAPGYYRVKSRKKQLRRLEDVASDMFDDFMARMIKRHPKRRAITKAKRMMVIGLPVTRILEVARSVKPKMVVMGSAGRTALSRFLLGSKAEQVLRLCPAPVTIVKSAKDKK